MGHFWPIYSFLFILGNGHLNYQIISGGLLYIQRTTPQFKHTLVLFDYMYVSLTWPVKAAYEAVASSLSLVDGGTGYSYAMQ